MNLRKSIFQIYVGSLCFVRPFGARDSQMNSLAFSALRKAGDFLCGHIKADGVADFNTPRAVRHPSSLENVLDKFQDWRKSG